MSTVWDRQIISTVLPIKTRGKKYNVRQGFGSSSFHSKWVFGTLSQQTGKVSQHIFAVTGQPRISI